MSAALYSIRLMWHEGRGDMSARGLHIHLSRPPAILAVLGLAEVQYEPGLACFECRELHDKPRDLTPDECARLRSWCEARAADARGLIEQP